MLQARLSWGMVVDLGRMEPLVPFWKLFRLLDGTISVLYMLN